ncbi:MAG TPA: S-layer homology domain-containing protein [Candidatus Agathobaculum intestinipullorum]|nr:S-layer homology domain-containing protein [Candidatus Agathobaculum intestinipullorum]
MKGKCKMILAAVLLAAGLLVTAGASSYDHCADQLKVLGLFQGTEQGYELDRAPTRAEAATMLVRLLGKEEAAKELEYTAPFTDLEGWEQPYVQYLYENGLTTGASATTFEPLEACSAQMYTTFLLRALGYSDKDGADFTYADAISFGESVGLVDYANCDTENFLRDHVAAMSLTALNTPVKDSDDTVLLEKLVADGAVDEAAAEDMLTLFDRFDSYVAASEQMSGATKSDLSANVSATASLDGVKVLDMTMPMQIKSDMNMENMDQSTMAMTGDIHVELSEALVGEDAENTLDQKVAFYYTDGVYYMDMGGQKVKMDMSFDDAVSQIGDLSAMQQTEPLCLIESIEQTGDAMTVTYSSSGMNALIGSVMQSMGMDTAAVDIKMDQVETQVTVEDGAIKAMDLDMQMSVTAEGQTITLAMTMDCTINGLGDDVTITLPDDLDTYEDLLGGADAPAA